MRNKKVYLYIFRFLLYFVAFYYTTQLIIGLTVPGNYYSSFVKEYLDYVSVLRRSLLAGAHFVLYMLGYDSHVEGNFFLRVAGGRSVRMVYSCLGIGVFSFWAAFVAANKGKPVRKLLWVVAGWVVLWCINVMRIALLLLATNNNWRNTVPHVDHHMLFNISAYLAIFLLIYLYDRALSKKRYDTGKENKE